MINQIREYIKEQEAKIPMIMIYKELIKKYNENDIQFVLLTYFKYDIENLLKIKFENKEKRNYQNLLRQQAFEKFNNKCVISGNDEELLLEVAHIKPVSECKDINEKSDINNVLLLWIDIHKYFDNYKISINPNTGCVETNCDYFKKYEGKKININIEMKKYLEHHYFKFINRIIITNI